MIDLERSLAEYAEQGFARLGQVFDPRALEPLRRRADDMMLGRVTYAGLFFQRDTDSGDYDDLTHGKGWEGPSLNYRKIEKLELDPEYRAFIGNPIFERIARARIEGPIAIYRAVLFNKASSGGTPLPWHQDAGRFWGLDRDPELQIWTALDDAPIEAGCLEVVPGSHKGGLVTPLGGLVPKEHAEAARAEERVVQLPARAGEVILVHNHVWHRSGRNATERARRAVSICYMSAATRCLRKRRAPRQWVTVFR